jgi:hypothetical protein
VEPGILPGGETLEHRRRTTRVTLQLQLSVGVFPGGGTHALHGRRDALSLRKICVSLILALTL